ncbi:DUF5947 family protein [Actinacidiphila acidipaludis]|uniref:DUF5947 family protein n=1 Tax=Actinacidiphila acidipaludis TaxID=2873382 RepID=A0ABS7QA33_9ACTN|nr:DUF5947 family protein [Streptomyces acidipaludis]MBY8880018.1 DUF5947 family protein [Streptomyces acidipaludis]
MSALGAAPGLRRYLVPRSATADERCELCSTGLGPEHRHLVDVERRSLACACLACAILFDRPGAGGGRFRTIPDRYLADPAWRTDPVAWHALGIPVDMAFFFRNSRLGRVVALYPSPAGATENEIEPAAWEAAFGASALARAMEDDVEALLVRRQDARGTCHLVPVDVAYQLVGRLRLHWQGFDGGTRVRTEVAAFFDDVHRRAVVVPAMAGEGGNVLD